VVGGMGPAVKGYRTEEDLAAVVVAWLEAMGADVYQEVEIVSRGIRADIVAKVRAEIWIIETKTSVSLALIEQAMERRRYAHRVYIAAPAYKARAGVSLCRELGIGVLDVRLGDPGSTWDLPGVRELVPSRRWNSRPVKLAAKLRPEHKTSARAGAPTGGHWTPFRDTIRKLEAKVRAAGAEGITIKDAIATKNHYASAAGARSSLATWVRDGRLAGVRREAGRLYATEEAP
jgi:hypothetical protein